MSKGYIIIAQNSNDLDYLKMAYALALSIKTTQKIVNGTCLMTEQPELVPEYMRKVFDFIVPIPWEDHAKDSQWKIENKWKVIYATPFQETVLLDADMIFTSDISYWWNILSSKSCWFTTNVKTFRGETVTSNHYRKCFTSNGLPNVYTAFFYFKKTDEAYELFKMAEHIFYHWQAYFYDFLNDDRPEHLSGDVAFALALKILGDEQLYCNTHLDMVPTFVHMKSYVQNIQNEYLSEDWTKHIPNYFNDECKIKIGGYEQILPFHYTVKSWLTDEKIKQLENKYGK